MAWRRRSERSRPSANPAAASAAQATPDSSLQPGVGGEVRPSLWQLFAAFLEIALSGFGGVLVWAHRTLVERRAWLSEREFAALLGLCQVLPGGNIINLAVFVGVRFHGLRGVGVALAGLMVAPFILVLVLGVWLANPVIGDFSLPALRGAAPVVAGLVLPPPSRWLDPTVGFRAPGWWPA